MKIAGSPCSFLAAIIASLIAKKTDEARNRGGSPTPLDEYTARGFDEPACKQKKNGYR